MRNLLLICVIFITACNSARKPEVKDTINSGAIDTTLQQPAISEQKDQSDNNELNISSLPFDYAVTDTGRFDFGLGDGVYAIIKSHGNLIDTIDAYYGFQKVDVDHYMYCAIEKDSIMTAELRDSKDENTIGANIGSFIIIDRNGNKIDVNNIAPDFGWFASPSILNGKVYYYQVKENKDSNYSVSAAEFDPKTQKTKSHYMFDDYIETDDGGYFKQAYLQNNLIIFEKSASVKFRFSKDFKLE